MKNKFDRFNDYKISIETLELNDLEKQKMINNAKKYSKKKPMITKIASLIAAILLTIGLMSPTVRAQVWDFADNIRVYLFENSSLVIEAEDYAVDVHEKISEDIMLEKIALSDENVYIVLLTPVNVDFRFTRTLSHVVVNGERVEIGDGEIGGYAILDTPEINKLTYYYNLENPITLFDDKDVELELHFSEKQISYGNTLEDFSYKIIIPSEKIPDNTRTILKEFEIPNSDGTIIDYIKINPISQQAKITTRFANVEYKRNLRLEGIDQKKRRIEFIQMKSLLHERILMFNPNTSEITLDELFTDVSEITFSLYEIQATKSKQVGESFKVYIHNK